MWFSSVLPPRISQQAAVASRLYWGFGMSCWSRLPQFFATSHLATGFIRASKGDGARERDNKTKSQSVWPNPKVTVHPWCHSLPIKIESLGIAHVQGEGITQGGNQGPLKTHQKLPARSIKIVLVSLKRVEVYPSSLLWKILCLLVVSWLF